MNKDEIGIVGIYCLAALCMLWFEYAPRDIGPSGDVVLTNFQLLLYTFSILLVFISGIATLVLGWGGLTKPRYGKPLVVRQYVIYWAGIAPALLSAISVLVYGTYIFKDTLHK